MTDSSYALWLGKAVEVREQFSTNLLKRIAATFDESTPELGTALPPLWQWCFFQEPIAESGLGGDGHPARGGFLPPADNRNRMWAGGRVEFLLPLTAGADATCTSTIQNIEEKHGRTGASIGKTVNCACVRSKTSSTASRARRSLREPIRCRTPSGLRRSSRHRRCFSGIPQ